MYDYCVYAYNKTATHVIINRLLESHINDNVSFSEICMHVLKIITHTHTHHYIN